MLFEFSFEAAFNLVGSLQIMMLKKICKIYPFGKYVII